MTKKLLALLVSVLLIFSLSIPAFAVDSTGEVKTPIKENKVVVNEYEMSKKLSKKSDSELSDMGYSSREISEIRNYHQKYVDHLNGLKKLNDSTLANLGYTSEQIAVLRNFDESEEQASILSATLDIWSSTANFRYVDNYTKGRLAYNWTWTGVPAFKMQDAVAASWNDWIVESNTSYVNYYSVYTGSYYTQGTATFTTDGNGTEGAGHKFNVSMNDNYYYAKSGGGTFDVRSDVLWYKNFYYYIAYGHSEIWPTISFSIGKGGAAASISFTTGTVIEDEETGFYEFQL